jgi:diadenosine tetraphosphate (Ap4A) HIT family hydrolase
MPIRAPDAYLGYLMVEPTRHVARLGELTDDEAAAIGWLVNRLSAALRESEGAEHVYSFVFGDRVQHLHVHLAPRYPGTPSEYWGTGAVHLQDWAAARRGGPDQITAICDRLRRAMPHP